MGLICPEGVDEDLFYQLIVAFGPAIQRIEAGDDRVAVNLLRCIQKMTPGLVRTARGAPYIIWIAVSLIHAGKVSVFSEAALLLSTLLGALTSLPEYHGLPLVEIFAHGRDTDAIDDKVKQIDDAVGLSFDAPNFSISIANALFRGMRRSETVAATQQLLALLVRLSASADRRSQWNGNNGVLSENVLGFFLALLPTCTTETALRSLLQAAGANPSWASAAEGDPAHPRLQFEALGITDEESAIIVVTFLIGILETAKGEQEQEMLYHLLAQASQSFPDAIALAYVQCLVLTLCASCFFY